MGVIAIVSVIFCNACQSPVTKYGAHIKVWHNMNKSGCVDNYVAEFHDEICILEPLLVVNPYICVYIYAGHTDGRFYLISIMVPGDNQYFFCCQLYIRFIKCSSWALYIIQVFSLRVYTVYRNHRPELVPRQHLSSSGDGKAVVIRTKEPSYHVTLDLSFPYIHIPYITNNNTSDIPKWRDINTIQVRLFFPNI